MLAAMLQASGTGFAAAGSGKAALPQPFLLPEQTAAVLDSYCYSCHDGDTQKGDIRLDNLGELELPKRLDLLNKVQEQIYFRHMPPQEKKQPSEDGRTAMLALLAKELAPHHASTLEDQLQKPESGNYLDHGKLFSGDYKDLPGFTPDRRWLISEFIFEARFQRILEKKTMANRGKERFGVVGSKRLQDLSLANPFLLPKTDGVRYYANEDLTGGHLSSMLTNAQKVSEYITDVHVPKRRGQYLPAVMQIIAMEEAHAATLATRRAFLESHIERLCVEIYGTRNGSMLPAFVPVVLQPLPELKEGEIYQKAPMNVSTNMLENLGAAPLVYHTFTDPRLSKMSDDEFRAYCERIWFYRGDHERTIQSRMALLREYVPEFREIAESQLRRHKTIEYKPLAEEEMAAIREAITKHRRNGDLYNTVIERCIADWKASFERERIEAGPPDAELLGALVSQLSVLILERQPTAAETAEYVGLTRAYVDKLGRRKAVQKLIQTFLLSTEFAYRNEFGTGEPEGHGRRMLPPRDASYAISYALTDQSPDAELVAAAENSRLNTRGDYRREVARILAKRDVRSLIDPILEDKNWADNTTAIPIRELRFFREFFGYPKALEIFKDEKRFGGDRIDDATCRLINEADRLVEYILEKDQNVFEELLTTDKFYLYHDGDNARMQAASDRIKRIQAYFKDLDWRKFTKEDLLKHADFLREVKMRTVDPDKLDSGNRQGTPLQLFKKSMTSITARLDKGQKEAAPFDLYRGYGYDFMAGYNVAMFYGIPLDHWDYQTQQPARVPNRKGILTHPAWLVAFAKNTETDPIHRGKWVREKLLAGTIPDTPISVDAVIPEHHDKTLRDRLASATEATYCWKCHQSMNPLGYAFESYDDFGRFRREDFLEYPNKLVKKNPDEWDLLIDTRDVYQTLPVNSKGHLQGTGDSQLDGEVADAIDLTGRLAKSARVRQSIIRHAFRYFLGRNEFLSDSKTLMDAEQAYLGSGGSFDAVIVSLLTSDSFIYRKPVEP